MTCHFYCFSKKINIDLKPHFENESIWEESFWLYRDSILNCLTLNPTIDNLNPPTDVEVISQTSNQFLTVEKSKIKILD